MILYIVIEFNYFTPTQIEDVHPFIDKKDAEELMEYLENDGITSKLFVTDIVL